MKPLDARRLQALGELIAGRISLYRKTQKNAHLTHT